LVSQRTGFTTRSAPSCWSAASRRGKDCSSFGELPGILAKRTDVLSPRMLRVIENLAGDWRRLDERIEGLSGEIDALS
jgi:hypothetical protein